MKIPTNWSNVRFGMKSYHQFPNYPLFCFLPLVRMFEWFDDNVPRLRQTSAPVMERKKLILVQEERNNSHLKEIFDFKFVPAKWCHDWMITGNVRSTFLIHLEYFKRFIQVKLFGERETGNGKREKCLRASTEGSLLHVVTCTNQRAPTGRQHETDNNRAQSNIPNFINEDCA